MSTPDFSDFEYKMQAHGLSPQAIKSFQENYRCLVEGATGMIPEAEIDPVQSLPSFEEIQKSIQPRFELLKETVVLKLNGGLGTSMGLDKAKSLLPVKGNDTFLDLIVKQIIYLRQQYNTDVKFMLMNSFSTSADTYEFLNRKYPAFAADPSLELMQNKVPKVDAKTLRPVEWQINSELEWCPPGHGDLYVSLAGSGRLDELLSQGIKYLFVSNSDNLGATLDLSLLTYFADSGKPFLMECCNRTANDRKGGHLAQRKNGQLILRESAQCADEDSDAFQDITRHKFFNTNSLWIRLDLLKSVMDANQGIIFLPLIRNKKTVDPQNPNSPAVYQLETAMGAAIESFQGAGAVVVPRSRFAPVKKCSDLFLLRSDCYLTTVDARIEGVDGIAGPILNLDDKAYKFNQQLETCTRFGIPSLIQCQNLTVKGEVWFSSRNKFEGDIVIINNSGEPKVLPPGVYRNITIDLTNVRGLGPLRPYVVSTHPFHDQRPGTSGLRKKTRVFMEPLYLHNFVQSVFDALQVYGTDVTSGTLVIGGDGRFFNLEALQIIIKIAVANGVRRFWIGKNGLLSTPATSAVIRERGPRWQKAFGAFVLSASHNPGGIDEDFGIKYNCENGGPAPENLTEMIYKNTTTITSLKICQNLPDVDLSTLGCQQISSDDGSFHVFVEVIDPVEEHLKLLKSLFDFNAIRALFARPDFSFVYDSMHGVQGPYAQRIFVEELGASPQCVINAIPKPDFNGIHADPNLTYAKELVDIMGVDSKGQPVFGQTQEPPCFGAAADGDADRNMILGRRFFVTPSDSLAIIAAHAVDVIPFFRDQGGLRGLARSMPTSGAIDRVAKAQNIPLFEVPTGWKFFGNLMDSKEIFNGQDYTPFICGEESFGTGSNHIREKDGMWAVLAWLSILAYYNHDTQKPFVHVEEIVKKHWKTYGRNFYCRYDYEGVDATEAKKLMSSMAERTRENTGRRFGDFEVAVADIFEYRDPVDHSVSKNQGIRFLMTDGSRIIFRLSGTAGSGATIRMYLEKYEQDEAKMRQTTAEAMEQLVRFAFELSNLKHFIGREEPSVIT